MNSSLTAYHLLADFQLAAVPQAEKAERLQWVHDMRNAFSPAAMLAEDGSINQEFFKPKKAS